MRELRREIDIEAPPAAVWAVLTDMHSYTEWNPFIPHLAGELREGAKLEVRIEPPGGRAMTFKPTLLGVERELRWRGRLLLPAFSTASTFSTSSLWTRLAVASLRQSGSAASWSGSSGARSRKPNSASNR